MDEQAIRFVIRDLLEERVVSLSRLRQPRRMIEADGCYACAENNPANAGYHFHTRVDRATSIFNLLESLPRGADSRLTNDPDANARHTLLVLLDLVLGKESV